MFEAFVGSFLGMSTVLALLTLKDKMEGYQARKQEALEKRMLEAYAKTQRNSAL